MPYNFEATFVQPLLTKLDNGLIKGSEDWADAITKAYIATIKTGLPQGTPPTLPAPGLNPTAPPPYPLGVSGFTTADTRSKQMYTLIHAYFYAKELKLDKGSIEGLAQTVKQLIQKLKTRTEQVKSLIEQANNIRRELAQLPQTIEEILQDLKDEIKQRFNDLKSTIDALMNFKLQMGDVDFNRVFAQELQIIDTLKNFDLTNINGLRSLVLFLSEYGKRVNTTLAAINDADLFKNYLRDKLKVVVEEFVELAKGAVDPTIILAFLSQLASDRARLEKVVTKIKKLDVVVRFLKPKLVALTKRKEEKIKEIKEKIQKKIVDLQKKLQERIQEYINKKKSSKAVALYKDASKTIDDYKKKYNDKAKKVRNTIKTYRDLSRDAVNIFGKSVAIIDGAKGEFETIKLEIQKLKKLPETYLGIIPQAPTLPQINIQDLSAKDLQNELAKLKQYFDSTGLSQFGDLGALVMTQVNCDLSTFKTFFEKREDKIKLLVAELISLEHDVKELVNKIQHLRDNKKKNNKRVNTNQSATAKFFADRVKSLKDLLLWITSKTQPIIERVISWIKTKIKSLTDYLTNVVKKAAEDIKVFALNLIPLKSDVQDKKDKVARADSKLRAAKHKIEQIKDILEKLSFIRKAASGSVKLIKNVVVNGNYKFSENTQPIDEILDGIYGFKKKQYPKQASQLDAEKLKIKDHFKSILIVELLAYGLIETIKDIKNTDFKTELQNIIDEMADNVPGKRTLEKIKSLADNPPKDPKQISNIAEDLGSGILEDMSVATTLLNLERKYLRKSREIVKTLCTIKELDNTKFKATLETIKNTLDKDQSFIMLGMKYLKTELKKFMVFIRQQVDKFLDPIKKKLAEKRKKVEEFAKKELDKIKEKLVNVEAPIMSFTFGLAARMFWTGAQWTGPTGTNHVALNLGVFTPMKALTTDGASVMIREMARGFEAQLMALQGLVIPPANTGIPPVPFMGYK
jgi:DNA repair exonuclease SbcCD ATPase subunit